MFYIISFIFWLCFGSFISVLIHRIKNWTKWLFFWRSQCPVCKHQLSVFDLIPIVSYILLKWKCRFCKNKISITYPMLEITTWLIFVFSVYLLLWSWDLQIALNNLKIICFSWTVSIFIIAIVFYDILFFEISFILCWILWFLLIIPQFLWIIWNFKLSLILWLFWFLIFVSIWILRKKIRKIDWIWWWDAIWAILIWFLTPIVMDLLYLVDYPAWLIFYIILMLWFLSAWIAGIIWLLIWKYDNTKAVIPFLPFMFLWVILFIFVWNYILNWILS